MFVLHWHQQNAGFFDRLEILITLETIYPPMRDVNREHYEFKVIEDPDERERTIAIAPHICLGFIERDSGYVTGHYGRQALEILDDHPFDEEGELRSIELIETNGTTYLPRPDAEPQFTGSADYMIDGSIHRYEKQIKTSEGEKLVVFSESWERDKIAYPEEKLNEMLENGEITEIRPLVKTAHR